MLKFLGRGSGFSDYNTSAFFVRGNNIIMIDCSLTSFIRLKSLGFEKVAMGKNVFDVTILVTHTHSDHISGIPMLLHYCYYVKHIGVTIIAPSEEVKADLKYYFDRLDGCDEEEYTLITADEYRHSDTYDSLWLLDVIKTSHTPQLEGKCFGYRLFVDDRMIVYTGDSNNIEDFIPYLEDGMELYCECSSYESGVHINIKKLLEYKAFFKDNNIKVYLMHLDNEEAVREVAEPAGYKLALLWRDRDITKALGGFMTDEKKMLDDLFDVSDKLYGNMCLHKENNHAEVFKYLTEMGRIMTDADRASFWKWEKRKKQIWTTSATGVDKIIIPDDTGLVGKALHEGRVIVTNDPYNNPDFNAEVDKQTGYVTKSILVLPVCDVNGQYIGAFQIINKNGDKGFDEKEDARRLSMAALICGLALESESFLEESHHDRLTKLKNRMGFYHDFSKKYNACLQEDRPLSMFISDIDKFKRVNDTYGHNAGDDVLAFTANLIESFVPEDGGLYRWGGEEFIMLMPDTDLKGAAEMAEKVRAKLQDTPCNAQGNILNLTMSFGCHQFDKELSIEDNVSKADEHLYTAKETGRNKVVF